MKKMSDDIVTRLREYDFMRDGDTPDLTMAEAADEIERLRAFADHLAQAADIDRVRLMSRIIALEMGATDE